METNILQNAVNIGFYSVIGIVMKAKYFSSLVHQASGFWHELPGRFIHVSSPLYISAFSQYFRNMRNERANIIEKYEEFEVLISLS